MQPHPSSSNLLPLCVDLDGTLITSDALLEASLGLVKKHPSYLFLVPFWFVKKGKAYVKRVLAKDAVLDAARLPYNQDLLTVLRKEKAKGRKMILITASDELIGQAAANYVGIFDTVIGSNGTINMSAKKKAETLVNMFGERKFSYAGNTVADLAVWAKAHDALVVGPKQLRNQAAKVTEVSYAFETKFPSFSIWRKALRTHQWVKNVLLFLPIITAHQVTNTAALSSAFIGFIAFSFLASAIYLFNDLFDLEADRKHETKRFRPLAAGTLNPYLAMAAIVILVIASFTLAGTFLPLLFSGILAIYAGINLIYSWYFKQTVLLDVIVLASLYALRIFAGSAATGIVTSSWLFVFAMFIFLSLALVKRVVELKNLESSGKEKVHGRRYTKNDEPLLVALGVVSGYMSLLVLALYITSDTVWYLYSAPYILWLLLPLLFFWVSRVWFLVHRHELHEDPIAFAIYDVASYITIALALGVVFIAT